MTMTQLIVLDSNSECDFEQEDECGWFSESGWQWQRILTGELAGRPGPNGDHFGEKDGN